MSKDVIVKDEIHIITINYHINSSWCCRFEWLFQILRRLFYLRLRIAFRFRVLLISLILESELNVLTTDRTNHLKMEVSTAISRTMLIGHRGINRWKNKHRFIW